MLLSSFKSSKVMSPLDRIAQLNEELTQAKADIAESNADADRWLVRANDRLKEVAASRIQECNLTLEISALKDTCALLRSQLADGQEQAKRDSATIAQQAHDIKGLSKIAADFQWTKNQALEVLRNVSFPNVRLEAQLTSIPST